MREGKEPRKILIHSHCLDLLLAYLQLHFYELKKKNLLTNCKLLSSKYPGQYLFIFNTFLSFRNVTQLIGVIELINKYELYFKNTSRVWPLLINLRCYHPPPDYLFSPWSSSLLLSVSLIPFLSCGNLTSQNIQWSKIVISLLKTQQWHSVSLRIKS